MQKSVTKRVQVTRQGKVRRRAAGLGHSRSNKSQKQFLRKKNKRGLYIKTKTLKKYI